MSGSVFFVAIVAVAGILLAIVASPVFLIPAVVVGLVALFAAPVMGVLSRTAGSGPTTGLPTTAEASYDPVSDPGEAPR
jgi:hypothetical protein